MKSPNIGITGAGKMGINLFSSLLYFNFPVTLYHYKDSSSLKKQYEKRVNRLVKNKVITKDTSRQKKITHDISDLSDCNIIIETITENLKKKKDLFSNIDTIINDNCIFATNSSSILPSLIIPSNKRSDKFVGLHFFFPVELKNIAEFIILKNTAKNTINYILDFLNKIDKHYLILNEQNAFILNKFLLRLQAGACHIIQENILSYEEVDSIVSNNFFNPGIFEMFDHIGIDTAYYSICNYIKSEKDKEFYYPLMQELEKKISSNRFGIKNGKGFYDYKNNIRISSYKNQSTNNNKKYISDVNAKFESWYLESALNIKQQTNLTDNEIDFALTELLGSESGPFSLSKKL